ncbi:MAG: sugar ABC transporter permease [Clostridiales bacterium]|uniref:carbohydrate ABC transporter permease n=1 Tax=Provencibacterium massiliense TaxID=1841868 RepID=UPI0009A8DE3A|nr:sugar ABC transporter permease [Provencibacterium massiliense]PWM40726.1 MAG: sugar ABC transporter permease [Clostridiales bacterium]RGB67304.1 sugar ABC transporter permease [Harryflintia acetispora]
MREKSKIAKGPLEKKLNRIGWMFVSGASALIIVFTFYPVVDALRLAFMSGKGNQLSFAGMGNFQRMLQDETLKKAFFNTFLYLIIQVPIMLILGLIIASMLQNKDLRFKGLFRTAIFLPCITSSVAYALVLKTIFANEGLFNTLLTRCGLISEPILWLNDAFWSKMLIIIVITWRWTGYNAMFYIAGLQNIEPSIYEAADLDGAGSLQKMRYITAPLLRPVILFTSITSTIGTLQLFDEVKNITNGGPANATITISGYIYNVCFSYVSEFGYASAIALVVVIIIAILSALQMRVGDKE